MSSGFKHNKKRNVGLIYEMLARALAERVLENDRRGAAQVMETIRSYYTEGSILALEKENFDIISSTRGVSETVAHRIITEVAVAAKNVNVSGLEKKRTELLHEINRKFGKGFFNRYRIPEYRLHASIQLYLDGCRSVTRLSESVQRIQLEEGMTKWMTSLPSSQTNEESDREIDELVVQVATKKFEEKYAGELSVDQRSLLETYSHAILSEDYDRVVARMLDDKKKIMDVMDRYREAPEVSSDAVTKQRFDESYRRLSELRVSQVNDENIEEMLLFWKLSAELSSNE